MNSIQVLAILPLRLESSRIPKKMLAKIGSELLCVKSVGAALKAFKNRTDVLVVAAVDSEIVKQALVKKFPTLKVVMTSPEISTGTDRVQACYRILLKDMSLNNIKGILNIQGDMPFMGQEGLNKIADFFIESDLQTLNKYPIATLCQKWPQEKGSNQLYTDAGAVKILRDKEGRAIYFSRLPAPYSKLKVPKKGQPVFGELHLGVYGFTPQALGLFCAHSPTELELAEGLEQLRALYIGLNIFGIETEPHKNESFRGIDTPKDLSWAKAKGKK